jgi:hypothetical protein
MAGSPQAIHPGRGLRPLHPTRQGPLAPAPHWPAEGRPTRRPKAAPPSAEAGGRRPPATPNTNAGASPPHPLVRPLRGRTTKEGPHKRARPLFGNTRALEAGGGLWRPVPGPGTTAGPGPRPLERTGRLLPRATCAPPLKNAVELGLPARDVSADRRIRADTSERPGARAGCRAGSGDLFWRRSGLEPGGLLRPREECGSRLRRSIASVEGMGAHEMTGTEAPPSPICPLASGSPHPCDVTRGRGPGPAVVPGPGTYLATEWAGAWRL